MSAESAESNAITEVLVVQNKMGIHARPAAMIVRAANKFANVDVWVEKDGEQVNGKSIMGLMMLAAGNGAKLKFTVSGPEATATMADIRKLFEHRFEEA